MSTFDLTKITMPSLFGTWKMPAAGLAGCSDREEAAAKPGDTIILNDADFLAIAAELGQDKCAMENLLLSDEKTARAIAKKALETFKDWQSLPPKKQAKAVDLLAKGIRETHPNSTLRDLLTGSQGLSYRSYCNTYDAWWTITSGQIPTAVDLRITRSTLDEVVAAANGKRPASAAKKPVSTAPKKENNPARTVIAPPEKDGVYFCAFLGDDKNIDEETIKEEENKAGVKLNCVLKFWSIPAMKGGFPLSQAEAAYRAGTALFIKEMPGQWAKHTPRLLPEIIQQIKAKGGEYYDYHVAFAQAAAQWGVGTAENEADKPIFMSLGHEMNVAQSQAWSYSFAGNAPEYKEYAGLAHDLLIENGALNVTYVFNPNIGEQDAMDYYPTDCKFKPCVDWIGFDKYQKKAWDSWKDGQTLYQYDVQRFKQFNLPMMIAEYGRNRSDVSAGESDVTISGTIDYITQPADTDGLDAFIYFDTDKNDGNWALTGSNLEDFLRGVTPRISSFTTTISTTRLPLSGAEILLPKPAEAEETADVDPADAPANALLFTDIAGGTFGYKGGELTFDKSSGLCTFSATSANDPGGGITFDKISLEGRDNFVFEIKGTYSESSSGTYVEAIAQVYKDGANGNVPTVEKKLTNITANWSTIKLPLMSLVPKIWKVQFILATDNGSCNLQMRNLRFE